MFGISDLSSGVVFMDLNDNIIYSPDQKAGKASEYEGKTLQCY